MARSVVVDKVEEVLAGAGLTGVTIYGENSVSTLSTNDQLFHPEDYAQLIVSYKDGAPVQLRDIAKVINGSENAYVQAWSGDTPGVNLVISRQPGANIVETVDRIQAELPRLQAMLPASVQVSVLTDRTKTIRASLHEVEVTLLIAILLVVAVKVPPVVATLLSKNCVPPL